MRIPYALPPVEERRFLSLSENKDDIRKPLCFCVSGGRFSSYTRIPYALPSVGETRFLPRQRTKTTFVNLCFCVFRRAVLLLHADPVGERRFLPRLRAKTTFINLSVSVCSGGRFSSYTQIPYALPPVGEWRFLPPSENKDDIRKHLFLCVQEDVFRLTRGSRTPCLPWGRGGSYPPLNPHPGRVS